MDDYGLELNRKIRMLQGDCNELQAKLSVKEEDLAKACEERTEAREECKYCNDCSMCLG